MIVFSIKFLDFDSLIIKIVGNPLRILLAGFHIEGRLKSVLQIAKTDVCCARRKMYYINSETRVWVAQWVSDQNMIHSPSVMGSSHGDGILWKPTLSRYQFSKTENQVNNSIKKL